MRWRRERGGTIRHCDRQRDGGSGRRSAGRPVSRVAVEALGFPPGSPRPAGPLRGSVEGGRPSGWGRAAGSHLAPRAGTLWPPRAGTLWPPCAATLWPPRQLRPGVPARALAHPAPTARAGPGVSVGSGASPGPQALPGRLLEGARGRSGTAPLTVACAVWTVCRPSCSGLSPPPHGGRGTQRPCEWRPSLRPYPRRSHRTLALRHLPQKRSPGGTRPRGRLRSGKIPPI